MKTILFLVLGFVSLQSLAQKSNHFGKEFDKKDAVETSELPKLLDGKKSVSATLSGQVESVCQAKGCWMKVKMDDGESVMVKFKDYAFFVPKDIKGRNVVMDGTASLETTPVAKLRHFAEDAGKSKEEVAKIIEPKDEYVFVANGVELE